MTTNGQPETVEPLGPLVGAMLLTILVAKVDQRGGVWIPVAGRDDRERCFFCSMRQPKHHDDCVWPLVEEWGDEMVGEALSLFGLETEDDIRAFLAGLERPDEN